MGETNKAGAYSIRVWYTGDTHFGHDRIREYCHRPFRTVKEMNEMLIDNWNGRVKENDAVIFLGDFCIGDPKQYLSKLNGQITFIKGNHDDKRSLNAKIQYLAVKDGGKESFCVHDPKDYSSSYGMNLVAHNHTAWRFKRIYNTWLVNCGVDQWGYKPISMEEILGAIEKEVGRR